MPAAAIESPPCICGHDDEDHVNTASGSIVCSLCPCTKYVSGFFYPTIGDSEREALRRAHMGGTPTAFAAGQWVRVRPEVPVAGGLHGVVAMVGKNGGIMLEIDHSTPHFLTCGESEITTDVAITREAHARQQAALRLAHAEAVVVEARNALRTAVKAEIAAMPPIGNAKTFGGAWGFVADAIGAPTTVIDDATDTTFAEWHFSDAPPAWLIVAMWHDGLRVETCAAGDRSEFRVADNTLDAALKAALCWLADRDVFLPPRAP